MSIASPVTSRLAKIPPLGWVGLALLASVGVLVLHKYNIDPEDTNWLDPGQPPINVEQNLKITASNIIGAASSPMRAPKPYLSPNLACWDGSWVGDC